MSRCFFPCFFYSNIFSNLKQTSTQDSSNHTIAVLVYSFYLHKQILSFPQVQNMHMVEGNGLGSQETCVLFADLLLLLCVWACYPKEGMPSYELDVSGSSVWSLAVLFSGSWFCYSQISGFQTSPDQTFSQLLFMCYLGRPIFPSFRDVSSALENIKDGSYWAYLSSFSVSFLFFFFFGLG